MNIKSTPPKAQSDFFSNSAPANLLLDHDYTGPPSASIKTSHLLPHVLPAVITLHQAEVSRTIIAAHSKQLLAQHADPNGVPPYGQAGHHHPGVGAWVIALHAIE